MREWCIEVVLIERNMNVRGVEKMERMDEAR